MLQYATNTPLYDTLTIGSHIFRAGPRTPRLTLRHLLRRMRIRQIRIQAPLIPPPCLMQRHRHAREPEEREEVVRVERRGLEDVLHEGDVDERELHDEGDGDGADEHLVLREAAAEAAVLEGGDEVEEDEAGEGLRRHSVSMIGREER